MLADLPPCDAPTKVVLEFFNGLLWDGGSALLTAATSIHEGAQRTGNHANVASFNKSVKDLEGLLTDAATKLQILISSVIIQTMRENHSELGLQPGTLEADVTHLETLTAAIRVTTGACQRITFVLAKVFANMGQSMPPSAAQCQSFVTFSDFVGKALSNFIAVLCSQVAKTENAEEPAVSDLERWQSCSVVVSGNASK